MSFEHNTIPFLREFQHRIIQTIEMLIIKQSISINSYCYMLETHVIQYFETIRNSSKCLWLCKETS